MDENGKIVASTIQRSKINAEQSSNDGKLAFGYSCYYIPEVLMNLDGCFSVRLRAPGIADTAIATYYMSEKTCMYSRSYAIKHYEKQLKKHILDRLNEVYGVDSSDEALRKAIEKHNELCRVVTEIGNYLLKIVVALIVLAVVAFAAIQAVYWLNLDNKIMFLLYKIFNKITDEIPRDRRF